MNFDDYRDIIIIKVWGTSVITSINKIEFSLVLVLFISSASSNLLVSSTLVITSINLCW